jgi:hypothetical protein
MSLDRTRPNETRKPDFRELPDGRKRLTRYFDLPNGTNITDALVDAYGTLDVGPASGTTAGFANLRLVDQQLTKLGEASVYIKVYEELAATAEVQVGGATTGNSTIKLPDGRTAIEAEFIQLAGGTYTPGTVGTTTAPGDANAYLQREEMTTDGSVRRIKRQYVYAGQIQQVDETRNNGALLLRTIVSVKTTPSTPSGYTLISQRADPNAGLPIYTYTFAKGTGEIARDIDYAQSSDQGTTGITRTTIRYLVVPAATVQPTALSGSVEIARSVQDVDGHRIWTTVWAKGSGEVSRDTRYTQSTDQGTTGATVISIRHLTATSVTTNPISAPAGTALISVDYADQDGYRVWNGVYAKGAGTVSSSTDTRDGGKLVIYRKSALGSAPSAPSSTIAGTVTLISDTSRNDSGYVVYERTWAEGVGEVSRDTRYTQSTDQGTTGATVISIRHLTATSVTSNPISAPAGTALISVDYADQDGYRVWNGVYAKGAGTVSSSTDTRDGGKLVIYRKSALGSAPSAPSATIAGTVTLISDTSRNDSGYVVYERTWAEGVGEVSRDTRYTQSSNQGTTGITVINVRHLTAGSVTSNPISTPAGTTLISVDYADQDGYRVWTATYAKGTGVISKRVQFREGGLRIETWESLGTSYDAGTMKPTGILAVRDQDELDGFTRWTVSCWQLRDGSDITFSTGKVTAINVTFEGNSYTSAPTVSISAPPPGGTQATATAVLGTGLSSNIVASVTVTNQGAGYTSAPTVTFSGGGGSEAAAVAVIDGAPSAALTYTTKHAFTYPGRVKPYTRGQQMYDGSTYLATFTHDVFRSPPIQTLIEATVSVSYQRTAAIGGIGALLYNPDSWATIQANWVGQNYVPKNVTEALPGYRIVTDEVHSILVTNGGSGYTSAPTVTLSGGGGTGATAVVSVIISGVVKAINITNPGKNYTSAPSVSFSGGGGSSAAATAYIGSSLSVTTPITSYGFSASCMGERVVNNNTLSISLSGGPLKPDGQTYALEAQAEPAFLGYDGTQYFRTTVISATIPNQESLPL